VVATDGRGAVGDSALLDCAVEQLHLIGAKPVDRGQVPPKGRRQSSSSD
jgi:hypothetical protein